MKALSRLCRYAAYFIVSVLAGAVLTLLLILFSVTVWGSHGLWQWQAALHANQLALLACVTHHPHGQTLIQSSVLLAKQLGQTASLLPVPVDAIITRRLLQSVNVALPLMLLRVTWLLLALPLSLLLNVVVVIDGHVKRAKRRASGARESALRYRHAEQLLVLLLLTLIPVFMALPIMVSPPQLLWIISGLFACSLRHCIACDKKHQ